MEADFSGWATKSGLKCSDGLTIGPDAFKHQDKIKVPLVWQHGHKDVSNVIGHTILENRPGEGVYCYGFFNGTDKGKHAKQVVQHNDIDSLSIWANELVKKAGTVLHGGIKEVSLVIGGANPGAKIESVSLKHADGEIEELEDEAIIYTGLTITHGGTAPDIEDDGEGEGGENLEHASGDDESIEDIYNTMDEKQKQVLHYMVGEALEAGKSDAIAQSGISDDADAIKEVFESMTDAQQNVLHFMVGEALKSASIQHTNIDQEGNNMGAARHNVFEQGADAGKSRQYLSHDDMESLLDFESIKKEHGGSLKHAMEAYADEHLEHGIQDIDVLFPDAKTIDNIPELFGRRTEWVNALMNGVRKSPFARIKTLSADITVQEARAKGYITGTLKREEFFAVTGRVTTPQTIYKKQKLDRDDIIDITDFDVVAWLKGEMRIMLDEEVARAILVGDGRDPSSPDKIKPDHIRPIAFDHELYTTRINVNISDADSSVQEALDKIVLGRQWLRGTGLPTMFTTETYIARMLLLKDNTGRKLYKNLDEVASDLRVKEIVPVEILNEYDDIFCILVNPTDYIVGTNRGGQVSMFDDFDIDYNQEKYLIETRLSGALVKLKSAMVVTVTAANAVEVVPAEPGFDPATGEVTIVDTTGVVYRRKDTDAVVTSASTIAVDPGEQLTITAEPSGAGFFFGSSNDDEWTFRADA